MRDRESDLNRGTFVLPFLTGAGPPCAEATLSTFFVPFQTQTDDQRKLGKRKRSGGRNHGRDERLQATRTSRKRVTKREREEARGESSLHTRLTARHAQPPSRECVSRCRHQCLQRGDEKKNIKMGKENSRLITGNIYLRFRKHTHPINPHSNTTLLQVLTLQGARGEEKERVKRGDKGKKSKWQKGGS